MGSRGPALENGRASLLDHYRISPKVVLNFSSCIFCFSNNSSPYHRQLRFSLENLSQGWYLWGKAWGCSFYEEGWR